VTAGEAFALLRERTREADELRSQLAEARKQAKRGPSQTQADVEIRDKENNVVYVETKAVKGGPLRDLSDKVRKQEKADGAIVASVDDGRVYLVVNFDESLHARGLDAVEFVRQLGPLIGGGGGGRPTLAEAGGKNPAGVPEVFEAGKRAIAAALA
jgi:alanyl-tRNA synthetase